MWQCCSCQQVAARETREAKAAAAETAEERAHWERKAEDARRSVYVQRVASATTRERVAELATREAARVSAPVKAPRVRKAPARPVLTLVQSAPAEAPVSVPRVRVAGAGLPAIREARVRRAARRVWRATCGRVASA